MNSRFALVSGLLVLVALASMVNLSDAAPFVTRSDKDVIVDVSPFFKMVLHKDPQTGGTTILDIDVLSGLVKVGYDRIQGGRPNVDVSVFGFGSNGRRPPYTPEAKPEGGDAQPV